MHTVIIMAFLAVLRITWSNMQECTFSSISTASILTLPHDFLLEMHIEFLTIHVQPDEIIWMIYIKRFGSGSLLSYIYPTYVFIMILIGLLVLCTSASLHKNIESKHVYLICIYTSCLCQLFVGQYLLQMRSLLIGFHTLVLTSLLPRLKKPKTSLRSYFYGNSHFDRHFHCLAGTPADRV